MLFFFFYCLFLTILNPPPPPLLATSSLFKNISLASIFYYILEKIHFLNMPLKWWTFLQQILPIACLVFNYQIFWMVIKSLDHLLLGQPIPLPLLSRNFMFNKPIVINWISLAEGHTFNEIHLLECVVNFLPSCFSINFPIQKKC